MATSKVVIAFGRFNPPTTGHGKLVDFVVATARRLSADAIIFPSQTEKERKKNPKNPLPFKEKVNFLKQFFPQVAWNANTAIRTFFDALAMCSLKYDEVYLVAGSDRVEGFDALRKYIKPTGRKGGTDIVLKKFEVVPIPGERDPDAEDVTGMSASKLRALAVAGDYKSFAAGVPTRNAGLAKQLYQSVRTHMGLNESRSRMDAFLFYGFPPSLVENVAVRTAIDYLPNGVLASPRARLVFEMQDPFAMNVNGLSFRDIRSIHTVLESLGYTPTVVVSSKRGPMNEARIAQAATSGLLQVELARDIVMAESEQEAFSQVSSLLREAEMVSKPKQPSEVDRMKDRQKQEIILTKQRQASDLLQAKQRELQKKSREDMNKIKQGDKPRSVTR